MQNVPAPFSLLLFGASGHLAQIKLYPALYFLALKKRLPLDYAVVGYARSDMNDDSFRAFIAAAVRAHVPEVNDGVLEAFLTHMHYRRGEYGNAGDFSALAADLDRLERAWSGNKVRLAYYSVPPSAYGDISLNLCKGGVHTPGISFHCIVEKPVGHDLPSFERIRENLLGCFREEEITLLDHYLGKEAVRNIYYLRFANPVLETLLGNALVHHVEITAFESAGLEGRTGYFEQTGTLRDMVQSHLLEIASLLTMDLVERADSIPRSRFEALKQFYLPPAADLHDVVLQGQYGAGEVNGETVPAYTAEQGVPPDARTNTFAALKLLTRAKKWQGVPLYLRSGKRLERKETRITFTFREATHGGDGLSSSETANCLSIILQGEAGMRLHLQTKLGGTEPAFRPLILEDPLVCVGDCLPEHSLLLLEAIRGSRQWFLTFGEVQAAWRLIDPVEAFLDRPDTPLHPYAAGTRGPAEADAWIARDGVQWNNG